MNKKIVVGMSGGVDSSVCAALLRQEGYDVTGAVIKVWREDSSAFEGMLDDVGRVCAHIGIPYHVLDYADAFRREVVDYFVDEYQNGRTPNPCARCNPTIKFRALAELADSISAPYIATGHYAGVARDDGSGRWLLKRSPADKKDQTYFMYRLPQSILSRMILPLGEMDKPHVREIAEGLGLPVAQKPDSQEICFLSSDYTDFINQYTGKDPQKGNFLDMDGHVIGTHLGLIHYTIGQRKGLGASFGKPMFVVDMNPAENTVTLGEAGCEFFDRLTVDHVNLIALGSIDTPLCVQVKTRHGAKPAPAVVSPAGGGKLSVVFDTPVRAVTPGQSAVFYDDDVVVGGGIIV